MSTRFELPAEHPHVALVTIDRAEKANSLDPRTLRELAEKDERVRVLTLAGRHGQSAALDAGFRAVRAPITVTLDADLQNDPADIPRLVECLGDDVDVVNGVRRDRCDTR